jgi:FkbM family methyltransferase
MLDFSAISNSSTVGRALRGVLKVVPKGARVPVLQGPLKGAWWIVGSATHGCWLGSYEAGKQERFVVSIARGDIVYDVGANVGFYTLLASRVTGDQGHVYAFEPLARNLGYLRRHVELNRATNATVVAAAAAERTGEIGFTEGGNPSTGRAEAGGTVLVPSVSLDEFVFGLRNPAPRLIKMDIEGGELAALRGALRTLRDVRPLLFLATHGVEVHRACLQLLRGIGYRLESLDAEPVETTSELLASP